jgi:hypothetical protein
MGKRRRYIVSILTPLLVASGLTVVLLSRPAPLWWYTQVPGVRDLPLDLVGPAFEFATGRELPIERRDMRGIFKGGLDPAIFVQFRTDSRGVRYVIDAFGGTGVESVTFGTDGTDRPPTALGEVFPVISCWQEGRRLYTFDRDLVVSGRLLRCGAGPSRPDGYAVFIDERDNTVYIFAYHI